jgi:hypothetical protein
MRTTVTLDPDVAGLVRKLMQERGITFKEALNTAVRAGVARQDRPRYRVPVRRMGEPLVPITKALQLTGELEDEERIRRFVTGS